MDTGNFKEVFTSDETKQLRAELFAANARIAELETELQRAYETVDDNWVQHQQLAALQALLQKKDEALGEIRHWMKKNHYNTLADGFVSKALSLTSPTDALAPYLRCVEALEKVIKHMTEKTWDEGKAALAAVKGEEKC